MKQSPREFMKMRRPEIFSDSIVTKKSNLNRTLLEYKLETITSNSQEQEFQNFCIKLCQLEIAPNLRMQTGPTGGGDSKADSETYPVSYFTKLNFWEGIANESGDRWAIAISAKKDWVNKVKQDAKGIVATNRDYKEIIFITNQFAKDKKRAEIEDSLSKELSVRVSIHDRTWILDRIFKNNRQKLAIQELNMGEGLENEVVIGPNDTERKLTFDAINKEIEEALSNSIITIKIAGKALQAALLARGMERPRAEVEGLFDRAIRIAKQIKSTEQIYSAKYELAWTIFFWFEDFKKFIQLYDELGKIAETSNNIHTLQRQYNLVGLLRTLRNDDLISVKNLQKKQKDIKAWLSKFANDDTRPSASNQAKMLLALSQLFENAAQKKNLSHDFREIAAILEGTERLLGFPYEESVAIIQENGDIFGDIPEYEKLINLIVGIDTKRKGEIPAAKSFLNYGLQHLGSGRHLKAIEYIGKSLIGLYKKESKDDFIQALYFIAYAYEAVGLLWAARGSLIHAASYATSDLKQYQKITHLQSKCCRRLKMLELKLGRVGYILEWHSADLVLSQQLAITPEQQASIIEESLSNFSGLLGCLLLKTRTSDLSKLEKAPDIFNRLAIDFTGLALLYLLGGEKYLPKEYWQSIGTESTNSFFQRWLEQPAQNDLPNYPNYYLDETVKIESNILGTHFIFKTKNDSPGIEICEMIIAALEAYLSTTLTMDVFGKVSEFEILLEESPETYKHIELPDQPANGRSLKVLYKQFNPHLLSVEVQSEIGKEVTDIVIRIIAETIAFQDMEKTFKQLMVDQRVAERSFNFLSPLVMLGNVLGHNPKRSINQWISEKDKSYPFDGVTSRLVLHSDKAKHSESVPKEEVDEKDGENPEVKGHQHIKTLSVINERLWEGGVWRGFAFAIDPNPHSITSPKLYLMFDNRQAGISIFKEWMERFGDKAGEKISIAILKGIDVNNPYWYKGLVSAKVNKTEMKKSSRLVLMTKISTMTPTNPRNLEAFLESFARFGYFTLAPFFLDSKTGKPEPLDEWGFRMKELIVKNAWEVGINEFEMTAIAATDNPVIPKEIDNAPVLDVLKMKRMREADPV